jgi:hypothetical protein
MAKKGAKRGAPEKTCPKCQTTCHARRKDCPECGYVYPVKEKAARLLWSEPSAPAPTPVPRPVSTPAPVTSSASDFRQALEAERQRLLDKVSAIEKLLND